MKSRAPALSAPAAPFDAADEFIYNRQIKRKVEVREGE